jgi:hypothetical protein
MPLFPEKRLLLTVSCEVLTVSCEDFTKNFELETELVDVSNNSFQSSTKTLLSWLIHLRHASSFVK